VRVSIPSVGWSEQLERPFLGHDEGTASLQAEGAIALCDDGAGHLIRSS
jgi:hypothetical protein